MGIHQRPSRSPVVAAHHHAAFLAILAVLEPIWLKHPSNEQHHRS
jgi:hypothetical protein